MGYNAPANKSSSFSPLETLRTFRLGVALVERLRLGTARKPFLTVSLLTVTRPSGYSQVLATGGVNDISTRIVSAAQSSVSQSWSWTQTGTTQASFVYVDAIRKA